MKVSTNVVGDSNDKNNFLYKFLLTNTQILKLLEAFLNNFSANVKLLKNKLHKIELSVALFGRLFASLLKN